MPTTAAVVGDQSPTASDSDEYEYEEIVVEEEIEVEEEVSDDDEEEEIEEVEESEEEEEEEEEEENGSREDVSRSIADGADVLGKEKLISVDEKTSQFDDGILTDETTYPIKESSQQVNVGDSVEESDKVPHSEEQTTEINTKDVKDADQKEPRLDDVMPTETTNPVNESSQQVNAGDSVNESDKVPHSEEQTTEINTEDVNDADQKESRLDDVMPTETTNPVNESSQQVNAGDSVNESIKVLHSEEQNTQMNTKDVNDAHQEEEKPRLDVNEANKRPTLVCDFFAKGWCIKGTSCRFRHIKDPPTNEGAKEDTGTSDLATSATATTLAACSSESKPVPQKVNPNRKGKLYVSESLSNPLMGPNTQRSPLMGPNTQRNPLMGPNIQRNPFMGPNTQRSHWYGFQNHNPNSSYHGTGWPMTSTVLSSSYKADSKSSGNDWEPSKPFKSRFLMSQGIYTPDIQYAPEIQYDPIRDSIEQPVNNGDKNGDKQSKLSSSGHVPSVSGTHSPFQEILKTDNGSERISIGSHVNGNDKESVMDVDSNEIADTKQENSKSGDNNKRKRHIGDVIQASEVHVGSHYSLGGPTKEVNNYKLDFDAEGDMNRESKSLRHFRAALIEFVKDLVKPTWREGKLSKDAHKLVVKKAVDKVLNSLPPDHIPNIQESVDSYLTSSKPKIMKLIEGYIEKYGKL